MSYDSDDSSISEFESNVHLGIPDGTPVSKSDSDMVEISRIGGQPVRFMFFCKINELLLLMIKLFIFL